MSSDFGESPEPQASSGPSKLVLSLVGLLVIGPPLAMAVVMLGPAVLLYGIMFIGLGCMMVGIGWIYAVGAHKNSWRYRLWFGRDDSAPPTPIGATMLIVFGVAGMLLGQMIGTSTGLFPKRERKARPNVVAPADSPADTSSW